MAKVRVNWGPAPKDASVKLFQVWNTSNKGLYVLAPDRKTAESIALTANHIHNVWPRKDPWGLHVAEVHDPANERGLAYHLDLVQAAIKQGLRGSVHLDGEYLRVGDQLIRS